MAGQSDQSNFHPCLTLDNTYQLQHPYSIAQCLHWHLDRGQIAVHFSDLLSKFGTFGAAVESLYMRSSSS
jgi:hypothetical protein